MFLDFCLDLQKGPSWIGLRKKKSLYTLKNGEKLIHLFSIDDFMIFAKSEREVKGLVLTSEIFSNNTEMEFR